MNWLIVRKQKKKIKAMQFKDIKWRKTDNEKVFKTSLSDKITKITKIVGHHKRELIYFNKSNTNAVLVPNDVLINNENKLSFMKENIFFKTYEVLWEEKV